jgi:hypothetical protein
MKVGLEMAKNACKSRTLRLESRETSMSSRWVRIIRFRLAIYVPGLVWISHRSIDFAIGTDFDFSIVLRQVMQIIHVCLDHEGKLTRHTFDMVSATRLSHVLCGPIADPPFNAEFGESIQPTLRMILTALRDKETNRETNKYSLEQAILLPTIILSCAWDRWLHGAGLYGEEIEALQNKHADGLALSGRTYLDTLIHEFEVLGIWDSFMQLKTETNGEIERSESLVPRDATSGNYETFNVRDKHLALARAIGEDTVVHGQAGN